MKNYASLYTSLLLLLLLTHQRYVQNIPIPTNTLAIASLLTSDTPPTSYYLTSLLLSQILTLSNTSAETRSIHVYDPRQLHIYLSKYHIPQIFYKIAPLPVPLLT